MKLLKSIVLLVTFTTTILLATTQDTKPKGASIFGMDLVVSQNIHEVFKTLHIPEKKILRFGENMKTRYKFSITRRKNKVRRKYKDFPKFNGNHQIKQAIVFFDDYKLSGIWLEIRDKDNQSDVETLIKELLQKGYKREYASVFEKNNNSITDYFNILKTKNIEAFPDLSKFKGLSYGDYNYDTTDVFTRRYKDCKETVVIDISKKDELKILYMMGQDSIAPFMSHHVRPGVVRRGHDANPFLSGMPVMYIKKEISNEFNFVLFVHFYDLETELTRVDAY